MVAGPEWRCPMVDPEVVRGSEVVDPLVEDLATMTTAHLAGHRRRVVLDLAAGPIHQSRDAEAEVQAVTAMPEAAADKLVKKENDGSTVELCIFSCDKLTNLNLMFEYSFRVVHGLCQNRLQCSIIHMLL